MDVFECVYRIGMNKCSDDICKIIYVRKETAGNVKREK